MSDWRETSARVRADALDAADTLNTGGMVSSPFRGDEEARHYLAHVALIADLVRELEEADPARMAEIRATAAPWRDVPDNVTRGPWEDR